MDSLNHHTLERYHLALLWLRESIGVILRNLSDLWGLPRLGESERKWKGSHSDVGRS
jgi:hypothetical protein